MSGSKKPATRRTVGDKAGQGRPTSGTRTGRGRAPEAASVTKATRAQEKQLDPVTLICGSGAFQLRAGGPTTDGGWEEEWTLEFGKKGFIEADEESEAAVRKVLEGTWSDKKVGPKDFQRNGRAARLQIIKHGLEKPPVPAWEGNAEDSRVDIALQAGYLGSEEAIRAAIRYEKQSPERISADGKSREPSAVSIEKLEALLAAQKAGVKVAGAGRSVGAAASAGASSSPLQAGAQGL